ncbi:hypothetical protein BQ8482_180048 [Mesorhizobium delmotii]|uniref:Transposase n=1 Tax=Mesorhizobium delmotii TaxID=1631247 RepID=A0A2P9AI66_9HYPH|nr:hypothetical protein BQ8482_180048 [Mesorhizobium delmotii]
MAAIAMPSTHAATHAILLIITLRIMVGDINRRIGKGGLPSRGFSTAWYIRIETLAERV